MTKPTAIDLFSGCGGVTQGLKDTFEVVSAVDNDKYAAQSYRANHPEVDFFEEDIRQVNPSKITTGQDIDLMVVCAPCQPFSSLNQKKKNKADDRTDLIFQACRFAEVIHPDIIFFENVRGLNTHSAIVQKLKTDLNELGYTNWLGPLIVNFANYEVPQHRNRWILVVSNDDDIKLRLPFPTSPEGKRVTVRDAIGDLQPLAAGEKSSTDPLHFARDHTPLVLERFKYIPKDGGSRDNLPAHLVLKGHTTHKGYADVYGRMAWDKVAPTLTGGCTDIGRGRFMHPRDDRVITLREAARLQTFPDEYIFKGPNDEIAHQIGNAVPVKFAQMIGQVIKG